jgi:hypothetical protein
MDTFDNENAVPEMDSWSAPVGRTWPPVPLRGAEQLWYE